MVFIRTGRIALGGSKTGLTVKAALVVDGVIDATDRDLSITTELGAGEYSWRHSTFTDGWTGQVAFYVGTLGAASDFTGVTYYTAASINHGLNSTDSGSTEVARTGADSDTLETLSDQLDGALGSGARTVTVTVDDGTDPLENATVRMVEGANDYSGTTNASGVVVFNLDDATYTVSIAKSGYTFAGASLVVDGTETPTYSMTLVTITPAADPDLCTLSVTCFSEAGVVEQGAVVYAEMTAVPASETGRAYDTKETNATSNVSGVAELTLVRGATYRIRRGVGSWQTSILIPEASTHTISSFLGVDE